MNPTASRSVRTVLFLSFAVVLFALGRWSAGGADPSEEPAAQAPAAEVVWTCPMHAQILLPDPVPCPICGMDLVPRSAGADEDPRRLAMSPAAVELAGIATEPVRRRAVSRPVRMVGKVDFDETAVRTISAWVPGRLERLYVDYTGVRVRTGDHLVSLFSPELLSAQEELLATRARLTATGAEVSAFLRSSNRGAYEAAREKLLLYGLSEEQVRRIEERGTAEDHVELSSPTSGVVIEKQLEEGAYVETGTHIYKIAALDSLWVLLDAYEQDLAWLRHGQEVRIQAEALPGEVITGTISFIDDVVHEHTRSAKVRVNVDNADGRLKPGMFVRAVTSARIGAGGEVLDRHLAGKWVSPMHPEIVKDGPGPCDVCGMDLVPAEELGLVSSAAGEEELPLVVPASAVLVTGRRAVAYVQVPDSERPTFEGREVLLGPRAGDDYVVLSGLREGELVATHGAFRIDSSMQILAKPSLMSLPADEGEGAAPELQPFRVALAPVYGHYLAAQRALAADDEAAARSALVPLHEALHALSGDLLDEAWRARWSAAHERLERGLEGAEQSADMAGLRVAFEDVAEGTLALERAFGHPGPDTLVEVHCSMAFDFRGASWLQQEGELANPYFGAEMLRCGSVERVSAGD